MRFGAQRRLALKRAAAATAIAAAAAMVYLAARERPRFAALPAGQGITDLALDLDEPALQSLRRAPETDVRGRLSLGDAPNQPIEVLVRLKGQLGSKRSIDDKPALKLAVVAGAHGLGFENLTLNNMVQDPTMLHEAVGYQVYADAGVTVPETAYVRLAINGQPRGLYLLVETIDRRFLARRFGDATGILYEGAYGTDLRDADANDFELDEGQDPGRAALRRLIGAVAVADDGVFYGTDALVDTRSFVAMMAVQVMIGDWDNYYRANNYRIYWHPSARRWFFVPTGIDQTFMTKHRVTPFGARGVLFVKCLRSARCKADYLAALHDAADRFERLNLPARMDELLTIIDGPSLSDPKKPYPAAQMRAARAAMRRFVLDRPHAVRTMLATGHPTPSR